MQTLVQLADGLAVTRLAFPLATTLRRIVIPEVAGSNPVSHPLRHNELRHFESEFSCYGTEFWYRKGPVLQHGARKPFSLLFGFSLTRAGRFEMARSPKPWYRRDRKAWFVTINGKRHNLGPDRKSAFQRFHELMARPAKRTVSTQSVAGVFDTFLEWTLKHRAPRTYDWYRERCQWFLKAAPQLNVDQLQPYHVQEWVDAHPDWADGHKRGCIVAVQRPFRWAQKMGYIERNPIAHLEKPQSGRRDQCITVLREKLGVIV